MTFTGLAEATKAEGSKPDSKLSPTTNSKFKAMPKGDHNKAKSMLSCNRLSAQGRKAKANSQANK